MRSSSSISRSMSPSTSLKKKASWYCPRPVYFFFYFFFVVFGFLCFLVVVFFFFLKFRGNGEKRFFSFWDILSSQDSSRFIKN